MPYNEFWWAVQLVVPGGDARAMTSTEAALALPLGDTRMVQYAYVDPDARTDSDLLMTVELRARSTGDAVAYAQEIAADVRRAVDLPVQPLTVEWVAPQGPDGHSSRRFLDHARDFLSEENYEMAVVAAQIHFETGVRTLLRTTASRQGDAAAQHAVSQPQAFNLRREAGRAALREVLGLNPGTLKELGPYNDHVKRRNAVVHFAAEVDEAGARESLEAVDSLWIRLTEAARQR